ncbi:MAG: diaminopimelate aminotransferase [Deltaproteobacteria bacterium]|nr:MAG: diaminopimelate aminotransferase [Deltaproteobacteria bacterium]
MSCIERVFHRIDGYREACIDLQRELTSRVALGPENGGSGEHEKTAYIKHLLEEMNPEILEEIRAPDARARYGYRPNLVACWPGDPGAPTVWALSHSDIVPPGDADLWETDPYRIRVVDDRIIGRGVEDNQHGFVSSYLALRAVFEERVMPKHRVGLAVVADEETGSRYGLAHVLARREDLFDPRDLIVVPDGGNEDGTMIEVAEKSMLWIRFTVTGEQCHASTPDKGKNSLLGAARLILALEKLKQVYNRSDELFKPPVSTFAPTKIEANVPNVNTIPGKDLFYVDCRILPDEDLDRVIGKAGEIATEVAAGSGLRIDVDPVHRQAAAPPTPADAPVVGALAGAIRRVTGREGIPMGIGGGTVAAFFRQAGLPAAVWCTMCDTPHQPNEYCLVPNLLTDAKIFACLYMGEY